MNTAKFKIAGNTYEFKEITLKTYYELQELLAHQTKDSEYKIVECLTGCPVDMLMKLKMTDWIMIWEEAQIQVSGLVGDTTNINPIITFRGVKYGLPAIEDLTVGEFADLDLILSDKNSDRKLQDIAAILYRPIIEQKGNVLTLEPYDDKGFAYRKEIFIDLPIAAIRSANSFFLQYANSSLRNIATSLAQMPEMKSLSPEDQATLLSLAQVDLGGNSSTLWLEKILYDFQRLRLYKSAPHLTGLSGGKMKWLKKLWPFKNKNNKIEA